MNEIWTPRELGFQLDKKSKYDELEQIKLSPFYGKTHKDVFLAALALGYRKGHKAALKKRFGFRFFESVTPAEQWVLVSIAIKEMGNLEALAGEANQRKIWELAEEYANVGIDELYSNIMETGNKGLVLKEMEKDIRKAFEKAGIKDKPSA